MLEKPTEMPRKSSAVGRRGWNFLRLALLWARKGGLFRNRYSISLNVFCKVMRKLRHSDQPRGVLVHGDREFSFDDTPIIHVKMHRPSSLRFKMPHIPCIKPQIDFDYDFEFEDEEVSVSYYDREDVDGEEEEEVNGECDEGIDSKAEEFIAKFYEQMKLQRQISYLQYTNDVRSS